MPPEIKKQRERDSGARKRAGKMLPGPSCVGFKGSFVHKQLDAARLT
jgi:hypothetical protein